MKYEKGSDMRKAEHKIDKIFLDRWSPRAMSGGGISKEELFTLLEAARWAPSSFNEQPWRFIYAQRDTKHWKKFFDLLDDFNKTWCRNAAVLVCLVSSKKFQHSGKPNRNGVSDSGAAWENLALQASLKGLVAHGMAGYDVEKARKELNVPEDYEIIHMIAIGNSGNPLELPEKIREMEKPNSRKPVKELVFEGSFK